MDGSVGSQIDSFCIWDEYGCATFTTTGEKLKCGNVYRVFEYEDRTTEHGGRIVFKAQNAERNGWDSFTYTCERGEPYE